MTMDRAQLVVFDMAGTTVDDSAAGASLVVSGFVDAFLRSGLAIEPATVNRYRGKPKDVAIVEILASLRCEAGSDREQIASKIYGDFLAYLKQRVSKMQEFPGTIEVFSFLHSRGIKVGVGTGFPTDLARMIAAHLGWQQRGLVDWVMSAEEVGAGRPDPAMLFRMMELAGVNDPSLVVKVGDTLMDILEGKNAGVHTVGVLTGTQTREDLEVGKPEVILDSVRELPRLL
jgi:phosphonatase-like hydrolase